MLGVRCGHVLGSGVVGVLTGSGGVLLGQGWVGSLRGLSGGDVLDGRRVGVQRVSRRVVLDLRIGELLAVSAGYLLRPSRVTWM